MILFEEAYRIVMEHKISFPGTERVKLAEATGRILAEEVKSDREIPPFDRVAVDGFACRREDLHKNLQIIETVPAGYRPQKNVEAGQCTKVMTGCPLPEGADMVFMIEDAKVAEDKVKYVGKSDSPATNFAVRGEDIQKDETVIPRWSMITPANIGVLASLGYAEPLVVKKIKVAVIATGDEVVEPHVIPESYQIRNSNSYQLITLLQRIEAEALYMGIAGDNEADLNAKIKKAVAECDIILMTGGVSMGEFDLVPGVLEQNGFKMQFNRVATKPGKPSSFFVAEQKVCFGLPGNPVSSFIVFETMIKPYIYHIMNHQYRPYGFELPLGENFRRKKAAREEWLPVTISADGQVFPVPYHGSGHFNSLTAADAIMKIPRGIKEIDKGQKVHVRQI